MTNKSDERQQGLHHLSRDRCLFRGAPAAPEGAPQSGDTSLRAAFSAILTEHRVLGPVERPFGNFHVGCQGCDWRESTDYRHQAAQEGDRHIVDLLVAEVKRLRPDTSTHTTGASTVSPATTN